MRRLALPAAALLVVLAWATPGAAQQGGLQVRVTELEAKVPTAARLTVAVSGAGVERRQLPASAFSATLDGQPARVAQVISPEVARTPVSVLLVIDTSRSMEAGGNMAPAKAAAAQFVDQLQPGGRVGVLRFSDTIEVVSPLTEDKVAAKRAIATLRAAGETALYGGIVAGAGQLASAPGQRVIVLLSDGKDTTKRPIQDAVAAAQRNRVVIYSIGLASDGAQAPVEALTSLAGQTRGRFIPAKGANLSALYASLGRELYSQYVVDLQVPPGTPSGSELVVKVTAGGFIGASEGRALLLPLPSSVGPAGLREVPGLSALQTRQGLYAIAALMFVAILLLAYALMATPPGSGKPYRELRQRLSQYSLTPAIADDSPPTSPFGSSDLMGRATDLAESLVRRGNLEEAFLTKIELAGLKMRVAEFVLISLASAFGVPMLLLLLTRNLYITIIGVMIGVLAPFVFLIVKASRRQARFDEQLPDTLQLVGGALQAGHSLLQAVDTVVKEADEPMSAEFQRVLTEARLGVPLEEALDGVAKRMNSKDFEWTVMAVALQRQIGGNLAELLNTVAQTIRERYSLKRQIRSLSAEGRLSSIILSVLPFLMFFALLMFNSTFLAPLYTTPLGLAMLSASAILMIVGILWMKKITNIEV
jgi:tight adherence protein B